MSRFNDEYGVSAAEVSPRLESSAAAAFTRRGSSLVVFRKETRHSPDTHEDQETGALLTGEG